MNVEQLQNQVSAMQANIAELNRKVAALEQKPKGNWLPAVLGRFRNDPEFDEAITLARQIRETGGFSDDTIVATESP